MTLQKGKARIRRKFDTPYKISALCKNCTPEKSGPLHSKCYNVNCICIHHPNWTALYARIKGLRTQSKPGDFDYVKTKE